MTAEQKKSNKSFWVVFALLLTLAAFSTIGNVLEYRKTNRLNSEGRRVLGVVDSIHEKGSKRELFVTFQLNGKDYHLSKKVKSIVSVGDSVPVYYLQDQPTTNAIVVE